MNSARRTSDGPKPWAWWVCGALFLATLLNYMDRQALPQTATELKERFGIRDDRYGIVERNFSWAFAVGSIFFGFVADRFGPRWIYPFVLIGWSAAGLATPLLATPEVANCLATPDDPSSGPYHWLLLCRTMLGLFEAGHWPCALITARQILAAKDRPLGNGILQSGASIGAIVVPFYVMAVRHLGGEWNVTFWTVGAAGLLWVPLWMALVRKGDLDAEASTPTSTPTPPFDPLKFLSRYASLLAVIVGLNVSWQFLRAWLPKYLKESQHFSADATDGIVAGYYVSADIGCMASGLLVRWLVQGGRHIDSARIVGFAVFAGIAALAALVPVVGGDWLGVGLLTLAAAGILGLHPYYYALAQELPKKHMGLLSGLLVAAAWFATGYVQKELGVHIAATKNYDAAFVLVGVAPLMGLLALVVLWRSPKESH